MANPAAPADGIHGQTTTKTTITETHVQTNLRFDPNYVKTIPGALKVSCVILDIIVFICGVSVGAAWRRNVFTEWSYFVSMTAFWVTSILLVLYLFHVIEKFHVIPWTLIEMCFCLVWSFFFFSTGIDCAVKAGQYGLSALGALSFFAFVAMGFYGFDGYLKFRSWRSGELPQGERKVQQTQNSARDSI